jgi:hypothetical protein
VRMDSPIDSLPPPLLVSHAISAGMPDAGLPLGRRESDSVGKMATSMNGVFREELRDAVLHSKVLVVGAGGIGCEILKSLVMSGFADIEIVSVF